MSSPDDLPRPEIPFLTPYATIDHGRLQQAEKEIYHVAREHASRTRWHNPRLVDGLGSIPRGNHWQRCDFLFEYIVSMSSHSYRRYTYRI